jgi:starch synthase
VIKILIVSSEVFPFAKVGGLADAIGSLAKALSSLGCDTRVVMPLYGCVDRKKFNLVKEVRGIKHPLTGKIFGFNLYSCKISGVTVYFVEKRKYFSRKRIYGARGKDFSDNALRFGFLSKAALISAKELDFKPDVINCNDWETALIPFYLKFRLSNDDFYSGIKTLFTIHNMAYLGLFSRRIMKKLGIDRSFFSKKRMEFHGKLNFMKAGLLYSDAISTVSRKYAEEILTPKYGCGLESLLRGRKNDLYGILNGADYSVWSPENDKHIKTNYDAGSLEKKIECKEDLLEYVKLSLPKEAPLLGCVTRLVGQKGVDLLANITESLVYMGAGLVILGRGNERYESQFRNLAKKFPDNVSYCMEFNDELAHKIEAGCDMFVMPSRYEPCGLNQMYSIKYGTIPVVRATGGLDDVIIDFDENREKGNGFKFDSPTEEVLQEAITRAISRFREKDSWKKLMMQAMSYDFSWEHSAKEYIRLYNKLIKGAKGEN